MSADLHALLHQDAERIAELVRQRLGERADRLAARQLLMQVFAACPPPVGAPAEPALSDDAVTEPSPEPSAAPPDLGLATLQTLATQTAALRRRLEGPGWRVLRPIGAVWVRAPYPQFFMWPPCAAAAQRLAARRAAQFNVKLALSESRIDWMEKRCTASQPGLLRPIRVAESGQGSRFGASELELLRKRGRSKFS